MRHHREIADDLAAALRTAAALTPPYPGDLDGVRRRGRSRMRRRTASAAMLTALLVTVAVAAPALVTGGAPTTGPGPADPVTPALPTGPPAQRLLLDTVSWWVANSSWPDEFRGRLVAEVSPGGQVRPLELPEVDAVQEVVLVGDGRLVMRGTVDLSRGYPQGRDHGQGPCRPESHATRLFVLAGDGSVQVSRDLGTGCDAVRLMAADPDAAYLLRGSRLVAHDLASGAERVVGELPEYLGRPWAQPPSHLTPSWPVAFDGRRLAAFREPDRVSDRVCGGHSIEVVDVETGDRVAHPMPTEWTCVPWVGALRLSPDGRYVAVAFDEHTTEWLKMRVVVLDLTRGTVAGRLEYDVAGARAGVPGLAWRDGTTLQVVRPAAVNPQRLGADPRIEDLITVDTIVID